jgi:hypothetical protein
MKPAAAQPQARVKVPGCADAGRAPAVRGSRPDISHRRTPARRGRQKRRPGPAATMPAPIPSPKRKDRAMTDEHLQAELLVLRIVAAKLITDLCALRGIDARTWHGEMEPTIIEAFSQAHAAHGTHAQLLQHVFSTLEKVAAGSEHFALPSDQTPPPDPRTP